MTIFATRSQNSAKNVAKQKIIIILATRGQNEFIMAISQIYRGSVFGHTTISVTVAKMQ